MLTGFTLSDSKIKMARAIAAIAYPHGPPQSFRCFLTFPVVTATVFNNMEQTFLFMGYLVVNFVKHTISTISSFVAPTRF